MRISELLREQAYSLTGLVESDLTMRDRALYCLAEADAQARESSEIPLGWLAAAQVFATLSVCAEGFG